MTDFPLIDINKGRRNRHVRHVASRRPIVDPGGDRVDLGLCETCVVLVGAHTGIGAPGRHLSRQHLRFHGTRPGTRVGVGNQRHRRQVVRPVTGDAVFIQDRRNVLGERRDAFCPFCTVARDKTEKQHDAENSHRPVCVSHGLLPLKPLHSRSSSNLRLRFDVSSNLAVVGTAVARFRIVPP